VSPRVVILGGGTGGTLAASRLRRTLAPSTDVVVVDQDDLHVYHLGLLFAPFGLADPAEIVRPRGEQLHPGIGYRQGSIDQVDVDRWRPGDVDRHDARPGVEDGQAGIPSIPEFVELIADTGAGLYACQASVDLGLDKDDFIDQVQDIITVGEFYEARCWRPDHRHVSHASCGSAPAPRHRSRNSSAPGSFRVTRR
jgi:hypothetical protein